MGKVKEALKEELNKIKEKVSNFEKMIDAFVPDDDKVALRAGEGEDQFFGFVYDEPWKDGKTHVWIITPDGMTRLTQKATVMRKDVPKFLEQISKFKGKGVLVRAATAEQLLEKLKASILVKEL